MHFGGTLILLYFIEILPRTVSMHSICNKYQPHIQRNKLPADGRTAVQTDILMYMLCILLILHIKIPIIYVVSLYE